MLKTPVGRGGQFCPLGRGGPELPPRHRIVEIVHTDDGQIHIAARRMNQMITPDRDQTITKSGRKIPELRTAVRKAFRTIPRPQVGHQI